MQLNRLFFALWPNDAVRAACHEAARRLRVQLQPGGHASAPERYHLTLLFLGDQVLPRHEAAALQAARAVKAPPFGLPLDQAGSFRNARAVPWWLGARRTPAGLSLLHERLRDALLRADVPVERMRFTPHLTIWRADRALAPTPIPAIEWPVDEFVLIRSRLDRQPVTYEILGRWPLDGAADAPPPPPSSSQLDLGF